jgi:hypothetical protein
VSEVRSNGSKPLEKRKKKKEKEKEKEKTAITTVSARRR